MGAKRYGPIVCIVAGCGKRGHHRKMCANHYRRWRVYGDVNHVFVRPPRYNADGGNYRITRREDGTQDWDHIIKAEKALGRTLPEGAEVHHVNFDRSDNSPGNLVICPSNRYHRLLHRRGNAYDACGDANYLKCGRCKRYDDPSKLTVIADGRCYHNDCNNAAARAYRAAIRSDR